MKWPFRLSPPRPQARIAVIHSVAMRMDQWRASQELVTYAQSLLTSPQFQTLLDVIRNESPRSYGLPMGASHDDHMAHAYKAEGYDLCLNTLEALATPLDNPTIPEATFAPDGRVPLPPDAPTFTLPESRDKE